MRSLFVIVSVQLDHGGLDQTDVGNASSHFPLSLVKIFELGPQRFAQDCSVDSASCSISRSNYKTTVSRPNPQGIVCTATQPTAENRDLFILFLQLHSNQPFYPPTPYQSLSFLQRHEWASQRWRPSFRHPQTPVTLFPRTSCPGSSRSTVIRPRVTLIPVLARRS